MSHPRRARLRKARDEVDGLSFEEQAELQKALYASLKEQKQSPKKGHERMDLSAEETDAGDQQHRSTLVKRPASPPPLAIPAKRPRGRPRKHPKPSPTPEFSHTQPPKKDLRKKVVIVDTPSEPTICHTPPSMATLQSPQHLRSILLPTPEPPPEPMLEPTPEPMPKPTPESMPKPTPESKPEPTPEPKPAQTEVITALASLPMAVVKPLHSIAVSAAGDVRLEKNRPVALAEADGSLQCSGGMEASRSGESLDISDGTQRLTGPSISKLSLKHSKSPPSIFKKSTGSVKRKQPPMLIDMSPFFLPSASNTCGFSKPGVNKPAKSDAIKHPVIQTAKKSASVSGAGHKNPIPYIPDPSDDLVKASQTLPVSSPPSSSAPMRSSDSSRVISQLCEDQVKCSAVLEKKPCSPDDGVASSTVAKTNGTTAYTEQDKGSTSCPSDDAQKSNNSTSSFQAQRKFAQNQMLPSQSSSGSDRKCVDKDNCPKEMPKTEDFLLFLCLKDSGELPERLAMFNHPWTPKVHSKKGQPRLKATGKGTKPMGLSSKKTTAKPAVAAMPATSSSDPVGHLQQACDLGTS